MSFYLWVCLLGFCGWFIGYNMGKNNRPKY